MTILWSPEAIEDLTSLRAHIANDNPSSHREGRPHTQVSEANHATLDEC
jgi:plasmid stabilization system protein ParE